MLWGPQTGQKRAKTREKQIDLPKKYADAAGRSAGCLRPTHQMLQTGACPHVTGWPIENTLLAEYLRRAAHAWKICSGNPPSRRIAE